MTCVGTRRLTHLCGRSINLHMSTPLPLTPGFASGREHTPSDAATSVMPHRATLSCCSIILLALYGDCCCVAPTTPRAVGATQWGDATARRGSTTQRFSASAPSDFPTSLPLRAVAQPTDVVKIRMQGDLRAGAARRYSGSLMAYRTIGRDEGFRGLWKGEAQHGVSSFVVLRRLPIDHD